MPCFLPPPLNALPPDMRRLQPLNCDSLLQRCNSVKLSNCQALLHRQGLALASAGIGKLSHHRALALSSSVIVMPFYFQALISSSPRIASHARHLNKLHANKGKSTGRLGGQWGGDRVSHLPKPKPASHPEPRTTLPTNRTRRTQVFTIHVTDIKLLTAHFARTHNSRDVSNPAKIPHATSFLLPSLRFTSRSPFSMFIVTQESLPVPSLVIDLVVHVAMSPHDPSIRTMTRHSRFCSDSTPTFACLTPAADSDREYKHRYGDLGLFQHLSMGCARKKMNSSADMKMYTVGALHQVRCRTRRMAKDKGSKDGEQRQRPFTYPFNLKSLYIDGISDKRGRCMEEKNHLATFYSFNSIDTSLNCYGEISEVITVSKLKTFEAWRHTRQRFPILILCRV
ncbi:hypothetical protein C8F01DRAFT_1086104 [Mycena amicta]|nr:hypothetical protein C8F01DRAFT_1086104 [Mycena amicta]